MEKEKSYERRKIIRGVVNLSQSKKQFNDMLRSGLHRTSCDWRKNLF